MLAEESIFIFSGGLFLLCFPYINSSLSRESTVLCLPINFPVPDYYSVVKLYTISLKGITEVSLLLLFNVVVNNGVYVSV